MKTLSTGKESIEQLVAKFAAHRRRHVNDQANDQAKRQVWHQGNQSVPHSIKGRGTPLQPIGRFESHHKEKIIDNSFLNDGVLENGLSDDWFLYANDEIDQTIATTVHDETVVSIISKNQSPDVPFYQSINPYRGCEHGCVYCFARPTHEYLNLSSGLDFETQIFSKSNAAKVLERELLSPKYQCKPITIGANTDPYQRVEKQQRITRSILEVLENYQHPASIITKSSLVLRDIDILQRMAKRHLMSVAISVTSLDNDLKRILEPRAASPNARLKTIARLADVGIPVAVLVAPVIPAINDHEIESIVKACANAGATSAHYIFLRLPYSVKDLFSHWLFEHFPMRAKHVLNLMTAAHDGKVYRSRFGQRMTGTGAYAKMINQRFVNASRKYGMAGRETAVLDTSLFAENNPAHAQYSLF